MKKKPEQAPIIHNREQVPLSDLEIGRRFYEARTKLNQHNKNGKYQSHATVYKETGVPASSIVLYEQGERKPNMANAEKLANHYGVSVFWLLGQSDSPATDESSQLATKITGLSAEVIDWLCAVKNDPDKLSCLNALLSNYDFHRAVTLLALASKVSAGNTQDDEEADTLERAGYYEISLGIASDDFKISNRQLIRIYRTDALMEIGNAFKKIAPADEHEKEGK